MYRLYAGLDLIEEDRIKCSVFVPTWCSKEKGMFKSSAETTDYSSRLLYSHATQKQHFQKRDNSFQSSLGREDSKKAQAEKYFFQLRTK